MLSVKETPRSTVMTWPLSPSRRPLHSARAAPALGQVIQSTDDDGAGDVVDEHVDGVETRLERIHERDRVLLEGDIGLNDQRHTCADVGEAAPHLGLVGTAPAVREHGLGAPFGEGQCDGQTDPLGAAGHQDSSGPRASQCIAYPPDTDTPQLAAELATKPPETRAITAGAKTWSADGVAAAIIRGVERRRFAITPGWEMTAIYWLHSIAAPLIASHFDRTVAKVRQQRG